MNRNKNNINLSLANNYLKIGKKKILQGKYKSAFHNLQIANELIKTPSYKFIKYFFLACLKIKDNNFLQTFLKKLLDNKQINEDKILKLVNVLHIHECFNLADYFVKSALSIYPKNTKIKFCLAQNNYFQNNYDKTILLTNELLKTDPQNTDYLHLLFRSYYSLNEYQKAKNILITLAKNDSENGFYKYGLYIISKYLKETLPINTNMPEIILTYSSFEVDIAYLGVLFYYDKNYQQAKICFQILENHNFSNNFFNILAFLYFNEENYLFAIKIFKMILQKNLRHFFANRYLGLSYFNLKKYGKSIFYLKKAIKLEKNLEVEFDLALAYFYSQKYQKALKLFNQILTKKPNSPSTLINIGSCYFKLEKFDLAKKFYQEALKFEALKTNLNLLLDLARTNFKLKQYSEALQYLKNVFKIDPLNTISGELFGDIFNKMQQECNWLNRQENLNYLLLLSDKFLENSLSSPIKAFNSLYLDIPTEKINAIIKSHTVKLRENLLKDVQVPEITINSDLAGRRLKIGFLSGCFNSHSVGILIHEIFPYLNNKEFEVYVYHYGKIGFNLYTEKIRKSVENFVDLRSFTHQEIINQIINDKLDILLDLNLHTGYASEDENKNLLSVAVFKLAPVQIPFLDFLNSKGNEFQNYLFTDQVLTPPNLKKHFHEKFIYFPENETAQFTFKNIAFFYPTNYFPQKVELPPKDKFVFCSFNNSYKIEPIVFNTWLKILKRTPNSILWLQETNKEMVKNLINYTKRHGVNPKRILFFPQEELNFPYLEKAHLFLDTYFYNACSSAIYALWMNCPVITFTGTRMVSRMAASLLTSLKMPELIVNSWQEYEDLAVKLANNFQDYQNLKLKLEQQKKNTNLFNTEYYVKNLEKGFKIAWHDFLANTDEQILQI